MAAGAGAGEHLPAERDRAFAELLIELRIESWARHAAGDVEVVGRAVRKKSTTFWSRSSIARKLAQSRRHWPMSNGVWP